ncbi:MAG: RdgB/HAM1 family non-canonical purine NTP pyrophosphatase [Solirubrobacterales bacterium]
MDILGLAADSIATLDEYPEMPDVEEDGDTFLANAIKKAEAAAAYTGEIAMADDSGLEVDALNGQPGVYSARFAGEPSDDAKNNAKLLALLTNVPAEKRTGRFRCVIAVAEPDGRVETADGTCEGRIAFVEAGNGGFGYDPLFIPDGFERSFGELTPETKHRISHRGKALAAVRPILDRML